MKKIKIFLAIGDELRDESLELSDLVEHLNLILEPQNVHIYLAKWDYLTEASASGLESLYSDTLADSEICMVVFGKDFGSFTESKLKEAFEKVCQEGVNPSKLYVYFKSVDSLSEELKRFRDSFPEAYGHFTGKFSEVNTLKNDFLLQFQLFQSQQLQNVCPVEVKNSKVTVFGKDLFIDLMKIPFLGNNETYTDLLDDIEDLKEWLDEHEPDHRKYAEKAEKLREKEEKREKMEQSIWSTAIEIARLSNQRCSERLKKAIELFNAGDNKGASAILDTEDILKDAEHNLQMKRLHEEGLKTNIEELKLKIKTLENEMSEGWGEAVLKLQEKVIEYTKEVYGQESEESIFELCELTQLYETLDQVNRANGLLKQTLQLSITKLGTQHLLSAELYNNYGINFGIQGNFEKAIELIEKGLSIRITCTSSADSWLIAESYNNLSAFYLRKGDNQHARNYAHKAYEINSIVLGEDHVNTGISLHNLSSAYSRSQDYEEALKYELRTLEIFTRKLGKDHYKIANIYDELGSIYGHLENHEKNIHYALKALNLRRKYLGEINSQIIFSYNNLGTAYRNMTQYTESLRYKNKAIEICKELYGNNHPNLSIMYRGLGLTYLCLEQFDMAVKSFKTAFFISEKIEDKTGVAQCLNRLGRVHTLMGDVETAAKEFREAISLLPEDHPEYNDSMERLKSINNS